MPCFLTGSHAYGTPTDKSDIDLVILCGPTVASFLWEKSEKKGKCVFGALNLITMSSVGRFEDWRRVNQELIARKPVTREQAVEAFKAAGLSCESGVDSEESEQVDAMTTEESLAIKEADEKAFQPES